MDLIDAIRREHGFLEVEGRPDIESSLRSLRANLERALNHLSCELYSKTTHFLLEFIQNADDNQYESGVEPTLKIDLDPGWLIIQCNEVGFEDANVRALCRVGASTKTNQQGYIGEKGIGFKAVFSVTNVVYILSREYTFYFDKERELGMITPIWTDAFPAKDGWTTFRLQLSSSGHIHHIASHLAELQPSLLLFLRKLRHLYVTVDNKTVLFRRSTIGADIVLESVSERSSLLQRYLVVEHVLATYDHERRREGVKESTLVLAFPLTVYEEPVIEDQAVHAFLPLQNYGFKFMIQGDFLTSTSRENILSDLQWNVVLRNGIPDAFIQAVANFKKRPGTQFRWLRFIPNGISDVFMKPVQDAVLAKLKKEPVVRCSDGGYSIPSRVRMRPKCGPDGEPLIHPQYLPTLSYISAEYDLDIDRSTLELLGVKNMTIDDFINGVGTICRKASSLDAHTGAWHESVCGHLLQSLEADAHRRWSMKSLKIIPLADGTWTTSWLQDLYFNPSFSIPLNLGVHFIRRLDPHSSRYRLFQKLGISEVTPQSLAERILELHSKAIIAISRPTLLAHVRYLFEHRVALEDVLDKRLELWMMGSDDKTAHASKLYMDHPRYPEKFSLSQFLRVPFIAVEYMSAYPAESKDFKVWCDWLRDRLGIHTTPAVSENGLGPEFSEILYRVNSAKLLHFLKTYWSDIKDQIIHSPLAQAELRSVQVICKNGAIEKLEATCLETEHLRQYTDLPFLPVTDPDDPSWGFLEYLGVSTMVDGIYSLKRLIRLSKSKKTNWNEVIDIYKQLEVWLEEGDTMNIIRKAFKKHKLLFCRRQRLATNPEWMSLSEVVWVAPSSVHSKTTLEWQYSHLKSFFLAVGVPSDCPPSILLEEIKPIVAKWKGKTIPHDVYSHVSAILIDIDKIVRYAASNRVEEMELGWLYALRSETIFPVNTPSLGLTLLSAVNDTFYLPDSDGTLARLFSGKVPILAKPIKVSRQRTVKSMKAISFLLDHALFNDLLRPLDDVVEINTTPIGQRVRNDSLSAEYTERAQYIRRLQRRAPVGHQVFASVYEISVYRVEAVETVYTIANMERNIKEELALELRSKRTGEGELLIFTSNSRYSTSELSRKVAQRLGLEELKVHLTLTAALDEVKEMLHDDEADEEGWSSDFDDSKPGGFAFDLETSAPDFSEVFREAEDQLLTAAFHAIIHSDTYELDYKHGQLAVAQTQRKPGVTFQSYTTPISIPSTRKYRIPSIGTRFSSSKDFEIQESFGEFIVYHGLKTNLTHFDTDNWTSKHRGRFPGYTAFSGSARAAITYPDTHGEMTEYLYGSGRKTAWGPRWPTYYLDVLTTGGSMSQAVDISDNQFALAAEMTIRDPDMVPERIYCIVRVTNLRNSSPSFSIFPDPHRLMYDKKITILSDSTRVTMSL